MTPSPASGARLYSSEFHADRDARTRAAAHKVLSYLFQKVSINSVCDVGCGVGTWLAVASELGAETVKGYEGPWAKDANLVVSEMLISLQDLESELKDKQRYDLAVSLEVAEHLSVERGPRLISELCELSDLILFSAAIPNQGGTGHVNEQWQSYWAALFAEEGFETLDVVRPMLWKDSSISWWYRQNTLVYAKKGTKAEAGLREECTMPPAYLDVVHPDFFSYSEQQQPVRAIRQFLSGLLRR